MAEIHVKNLPEADTGITGEPIRERVTYGLLTLSGMVDSGHTDKSPHESDPTAIRPIQFEKHLPTLSRNPSGTTESANLI
ncbi:MAG: hypothetical protein KC587_03955 [Nitrospira sp.]|nr:hypothetical protein [Nitrospira sp.]